MTAALDPANAAGNAKQSMTTKRSNKQTQPIKRATTRTGKTTTTTGAPERNGTQRARTGTAEKRGRATASASDEPASGNHRLANAAEPAVPIGRKTHAAGATDVLEPPLSKGEVRIEFVAASETVAKDMLRFFDDGDTRGMWLMLEPPRQVDAGGGLARFQVRIRPGDLSLHVNEPHLADAADDDEVDDPLTEAYEANEYDVDAEYAEDDDDDDDDDDDY